MDHPAGIKVAGVSHDGIAEFKFTDRQTLADDFGVNVRPQAAMGFRGKNEVVVDFADNGISLGLFDRAKLQVDMLFVHAVTSSGCRHLYG